MFRRTSLCFAVAAALALASPSGAFAQERGASPTPEQRQKMAEVHDKMAQCLKSDRAISECRDEMHQSCREMMGESGCPMMGMGKGGMGPGMGQGMGPGGMGGGMTTPPQPEPQKQ